MSNLGNKDVMAANIKHYMELNHKERQDLCHDLNIKYTTLCDWINAKTYPRIDAIELMANYFHVSKAALIEERSAPSLPGSIKTEMTSSANRIILLGRDGRRVEKTLTDAELDAYKALIDLLPDATDDL